MARAVVRGDKQLAGNIRSLGRAFGAAEMDAVCKATLEPIRARTEINAAALRDTTHNPPGGHLDQGVVTAKIKSNPTSRVFWVSFKRRARKIAHLVEFGTWPHWQPRRFGGMMHPGARPKPFFRPAFEAEKGPALNIFAAVTWAILMRKLSSMKKDAT